MVPAVLALIAGGLLLQQFSGLPDARWVPVGMASAGLLAACRKWIPAGFVFGFVWSLAAAAWSLSHGLEPGLEDKELMVTGVVTELPRAFPWGVRFIFEIDSVLQPPGASVPQRVRLTWSRPSSGVEAGQRWQLMVRLRRPHGSLNPGGFDYERWLFEQRIRATGYVSRSRDNRPLGRPNLHTWSLGAWRQNLDRELDRALAGSPMRGLIKALTIGVGDEISTRQWEILRRTGTAHLVAISGMHISLIAGLCFLLARGVWACTAREYISPPKAAALAAIIVAFTYSALAGFSIPTQRAMVMVIIVMGGVFWRRNLASVRVLAMAALLIVLYDPLATLSAGFWLSFLGVVLIAFALAGRLTASGYWRGSQRVNWITALGSAPLLLFCFYKVSLIAPIANFIAVPWVSLGVVPVSLAGTLLLPLSPELGKLVLGVADAAMEALWWALVRLSGLSISLWSQAQPPLWAVPAAVLGIFVMTAPRGVPGRWLGVLLLLPLALTRPLRPAPAEVWFTLLDVGQGLSAAVQTANHVLVFDAGARYGERFDMGSAVVAPFLASQGYDGIDTLIVSHGDNDHIGGVRALFTLFSIGRTYTSVPEKLPWASATPCESGQGWRWDGVDFQMLSPFPRMASDGNDGSCVLKVTAAGGSVLLTGDIEHAAELRLVEHYGEALASDLLVVPHHGSATSSTWTFLRAVEPDYALIPAGYRNRYGFPGAAVLARYRALGANVYNTADQGAIRVVLDARRGITKVEGYRHSHGRYWHEG